MKNHENQTLKKQEHMENSQEHMENGQLEHAAHTLENKQSPFTQDMSTEDLKCKSLIQHYYIDETNNICLNQDIKNHIISTTSHASLFTRIKIWISNALEYEITIPIQAMVACLAVIIFAGYLLYVPVMKVSQEDIEAAKIHYESSIGGIINENNQNKN